ncbi:MAG: 5-methyltetrahydropteroyltriglutamate--homocysteine S-methyltransferase [Pantoea sp. Brub]|nr:5-methyltetrahydropteroyltriglutamate--homocysteine S-methyltransferase [Pantoea sp. Brub]
MTIFTHTLGFPRIGLHRELKKAQEQYWSGNSTKENLLSTGAKLRMRHWKQQKTAGIDVLPVGDFAWYDHVLTTSLMLGNIPERHKDKDVSIDTMFRIARGSSFISDTNSAYASEMKKWFNTNYHYIVPEFKQNQQFKLTWVQLLEEVDEALLLGYKIKVVLLGPLTYLWLGKIKGKYFNRLLLLNNILIVYKKILLQLMQRNIEWVQMDEPILGLDLSMEWQDAFKMAYNFLKNQVKLLITTYFGSISHNIDLICKLPIQGLHIDLIQGKDNIEMINDYLPSTCLLSVGIINGRNVWRTNLNNCFKLLKSLIHKRKNIWIGTSCSLLHTPIDLEYESFLDINIKNWFSFALQKCHELFLLKNALNDNNLFLLTEWSNPIISRSYSKNIYNSNVHKRLQTIEKHHYYRQNKYEIRTKLQKKLLKLPILPITTIGSFPQTSEIRNLRLRFKKGKLDYKEYRTNILNTIKTIIAKQEKLEIDVLVHGEPERNDMVEYFSEHLDGFISTKNGWIQSYGSRCVKPPIIVGDIARPKDITIEWIKYAQSLTTKPVKGILTGPVTILYWSFPREDLSHETIAKQIALAIRDEVQSLEESGIHIIQIDEPALREGLPLHKSNWNEYLTWAVDAFRLSSSIVKDETQIHTHMCYSEFNDIIDAIINLDVDVITIETSCADIDLFKYFKNLNEIGPGVYNIHSPNIPSIDSIENLLKELIKYVPKERLWVNPDCGLKTRSWQEINKSLSNMVKAVKNMRIKMI